MQKKENTQDIKKFEWIKKDRAAKIVSYAEIALSQRIVDYICSNP